MPDLDATSEPAGPPRVTREEVIAKCDYFTRVHLWPLRTALDPDSWLRNFRTGEVDHAVHLLNAFLYFPRDLVVEMFASSIQALSRRTFKNGDSFITAISSWQMFFDRTRGGASRGLPGIGGAIRSRRRSSAIGKIQANLGCSIGHLYCVRLLRVQTISGEPFWKRTAQSLSLRKSP